jgi:hypothetical protein
MKLLRHPIVVGILAMIAVALVFKNAIWPMMRRSSSPQPARKPATAVTPPLTTPFTSALKATDQARSISKPVSNTTAVADAGLAAISTTSPAPRTMNAEAALLRTNSARWAESPLHDPFQVRHLRGGAFGTNAYPPAMELLTLSAIWRQTGSTLAVINKRVFNQGDTILRFTIQSIEVDRVWVDGPNGREAVDFKLEVPEEPYEQPPRNPDDAPVDVPKPNL